MTWVVIIAVIAGTYLLRASMLVALGNRRLPGWTDRPMALVSPAAIAALVASSLAIRDGNVAVPPLPEIVAVAAGYLAVRRSGNLMHAFALGLPVLWVATAIANL